MRAHPPVKEPQLAPSPRDEVSISRWAKGGCIVGVVVLLAALFGGYLLLDRGIHILAERAMQQLRSNLPADLAPAELERTLSNLDLLDNEIRRRSDPGELIGGFLRHAAPALEDRKLTSNELAAVNQYIEQALGLDTTPTRTEPAEQAPKGDL